MTPTDGEQSYGMSRAGDPLELNGSTPPDGSLPSKLPSPRVGQILLDAGIAFGGWIGVLALSNITEELKRSTGRSLVMAIVTALATLAIMERRSLYAGRPATLTEQQFAGWQALQQMIARQSGASL